MRTVRNLLAGLALVGCGEIRTLELDVRPRYDDYERSIQPLLEETGCSAPGECHTIPQGELQVTLSPTPAEMVGNYLSVKARLNSKVPERSRILIAPLAGNADLRHPTCYASSDDCAYRKLIAWIRWDGAADPRPDEVGCALPTTPTCAYR